MRILICGANGFIGRALAARLSAAGHEVVRGVRTPGASSNNAEIAIDFARDVDTATWLPRLAGIDAVINAVGILVEGSGKTFDAIHSRAPQALFAAARAAGVKRVVQISALGADAGNTPYFTTKRAADDFLMTQPLEWQVLRPALVYGDDGASAGFFRMLASLPLAVLPGDGRHPVQPVHIDDLTEAVARLLDPAAPARQCIDLVGATAVEYREMLRIYRAAMGFAQAPQIGIPAPLIGLAAHALAWLPGAMLTPDTWKMLRTGNTGDVAATARLLGRAPRGLRDFIGAPQRVALRHEALAVWRNLLLRGVLAVVWLASGLISACVMPAAQGLELLGRVGIAGSLAPLALYGSAALDAAFGIATLLAPGRRLWLAQIALVGFYTVVIGGYMPEFLTHPFGPLLKNLPILAILILLYAEEQPT